MITRRKLVVSSLIAGAIPLTSATRTKATGPLTKLLGEGPGIDNESGGHLESVNVNETVVRYISAWNERDPKRRRVLVAETWAEDGSYVDANRHATSHDAIDAMLAAAQAQFPGCRVRLISGIEAHNNFARFSWAAAGSEETPLCFGGTDFVTLTSDGRFKAVAGFTDAAPAAIG